MYLFDLDGTLIDSNGIWAEVDRTFLARRGYPYTKEYYEGVAHTIFPLAAVFTKEYCHLSESTDEIMAEWMELAKDNYAHVALKPHVREYLEKLRAQGERMAVFTSCVPAHCKTALAVHDLNRCFERVIFAQELGMDKSDPAHFRQGDRSCSASRRRSAFSSTTRSSPAAAPRASGMTVIGVYDRFSRARRTKCRSFATASSATLVKCCKA